MPRPDDRSDLFDFLLESIRERRKAEKGRYQLNEVFPLWFIDLFFQDPIQKLVADGSRDGKIDVFFSTRSGNLLKDHIVNCKFTEEFNKISPVQFYEEIVFFWKTFENKQGREKYLETYIPEQMRSRYRDLYRNFDSGDAELIFLTNCRCNDVQHEQVKDLPMKFFYLDDLLQYLVDDFDSAMPRTSDLHLTDIHTMVSPATEDTEVPTSIVFAKLIDFIKYMQKDPYDLLFARNVRLNLGNTGPNKDIKETFKKSPREFAFSNNGITILCEKHRHEPGTKELILVNPRVVNGSQTLHSIRDVQNPSNNARVMVRILEIKPPVGANLKKQLFDRKEIINKISTRSNQQNPIKKWDLVANDEFQMDLYRFFRRKGLFYERRAKEWSARSKDLKGVGINRGPYIKKFMQVLASYYWNHPELGPASAKAGVGDLFEREDKDDPYLQLAKTSPEIAYQTFLLYRLTENAVVALLGRKAPQYVENLTGHMDLVLFALLVKSFEVAGFSLGDPGFLEFLELMESDEAYERALIDLVGQLVKFIHTNYKSEAVRFLKENKKPLTFNNYFKTNSHVVKVLSASLPSAIRSKTKALIRGPS